MEKERHRGNLVDRGVVLGGYDSDGFVGAWTGLLLGLTVVECDRCILMRRAR